MWTQNDYSFSKQWLQWRFGSGSLDWSSSMRRFWSWNPESCEPWRNSCRVKRLEGNDLSSRDWWSRWIRSVISLLMRRDSCVSDPLQLPFKVESLSRPSSLRASSGAEYAPRKRQFRESWLGYSFQLCFLTWRRVDGTVIWIWTIVWEPYVQVGIAFTAV